MEFIKWNLLNGIFIVNPTVNSHDVICKSWKTHPEFFPKPDRFLENTFNKRFLFENDFVKVFKFSTDSILAVLLSFQSCYF